MSNLNTDSALLVAALAREIGGVTHIYDCYLDVAFNKVSKGKDLTNVNPEVVKEKACEIVGLDFKARGES